MKSKKILILGCSALICVIAACVLLLFSRRDMTGLPYSEIAAYMADPPRKQVTYTVTIEGGAEALELNESTEIITLTTGDQVSGLAAQAEYLQHAAEIRLDFVPTEQHLTAVYLSFPNAEILFDSFSVGGISYPANTAEIDLSGYISGNMEEAVRLLQTLPQIKTVELMDADGQSQLTVDDVLLLQEQCPDVLFRYSFDLFGQSVTTETESLIYKNVAIGDAGLDEFRRIMPIMKNLTYLRLDSCGTTDEATAQLRDALSDRCKVAWRIYFGQNNCLTDTYKIWADRVINDEQAQSLKYCNEVKYLDIGHSHFTNVDFMAYMPDVEMAIVAIGLVEDLSGLANCTKLEYLEIFSNKDLTDEDLRYLSGLTNIKYLNISNLPKVRDLSFTDNMPQLRLLWSTMNFIDDAEIQRVAELHPGCTIKNFRGYGDPTDYGWRLTAESHYTKLSPVYTLVRARFGYDTLDHAIGDRGYLREEITFESLGITPP